jgi:hypothetical protein
MGGLKYKATTYIRNDKISSLKNVCKIRTRNFEYKSTNVLVLTVVKQEPVFSLPAGTIFMPLGPDAPECLSTSPISCC